MNTHQSNNKFQKKADYRRKKRAEKSQYEKNKEDMEKYLKEKHGIAPDEWKSTTEVKIPFTVPADTKFDEDVNNHIATCLRLPTQETKYEGDKMIINKFDYINNRTYTTVYRLSGVVNLN